MDKNQQTLLEAIYSKVSEIEISSREVLTSKQAAKYLGVSMSNLYRLTSSNRIGYYKNAKFIYFKRTELDAWMLQNKVKSSNEIASEAETYLAIKK